MVTLREKSMAETLEQFLAAWSVDPNHAKDALLAFKDLLSEADVSFEF